MTRTNDATARRVTDFGDILPSAAGQTYDPDLRAFMAQRGYLVDREAVRDVPLDLDDEMGEDPGLTNLMVSVAVVAVAFAGVFVFGRVLEMFATAGVA